MSDNDNGMHDDREPEDMASWLRSALPDLKAKQAEAEAHEASCTARPCTRCERYVCGCGADVDGRTKCNACAMRDALGKDLGPTRKSVPARFQWALDASPDLLATRVRGDREKLSRGILAPPSTGLLFMGPTGAGKTSLATAMLGAWVRTDPGRRRGAIFVEASNLARARARFRLGGGEAPLVDQCMTAPLLLLDDLGQEREDRDGCLTDVIYGRSNGDLPTWVTCGLTTRDTTFEAFAERLSHRYDGGFMRRIIEGRRVTLGAKS